MTTYPYCMLQVKTNASLSSDYKYGISPEYSGTIDQSMNTEQWNNEVIDVMESIEAKATPPNYGTVENVSLSRNFVEFLFTHFNLLEA